MGGDAGVRFLFATEIRMLLTLFCSLCQRSDDTLKPEEIPASNLYVLKTSIYSSMSKSE